jgi:hypothetical protein
MRTVLKICGMKDSTFYSVNDIVFATVFLFARMLVTPLILIYMLEGHNILVADKVGTSLILYIQLFWCYRILYLILEKIRNSFKDKSGTVNAPFIVDAMFNIFKNLTSDKKSKYMISLVNLVLVVVVPLYLYRHTLLNNY